MNKEVLRLEIRKQTKSLDFIPENILRLVSEFFESNMPEDDTLENIIMVEFGVTPTELKSRSRKMPLPILRSFCYHELYKQGFNDTYIGNGFNRDRTTVIHAVKSLKRDIETGYKPVLNLKKRFDARLELSKELN